MNETLSFPVVALNIYGFPIWQSRSSLPAVFGFWAIFTQIFLYILADFLFSEMI